MIRTSTLALTSLVAAALASCGTGGGAGTDATAGPTTTGLSQRLNQDQGFTRDTDGNWVPRSDKRSQYDGRRTANLNPRNTVNTGSYTPAEYKKTEWTRTRAARTHDYAGKTDGSRFQSSASAQGQSARQSGTRARTPGSYRTQGFGTNAAREGSARRHDRPTDAHTQTRREIYVEPEITDWREQRSLSIEQSRSLLAR